MLNDMYIRVYKQLIVVSLFISIVTMTQNKFEIRDYYVNSIYVSGNKYVMYLVF